MNFVQEGRQLLNLVDHEQPGPAGRMQGGVSLAKERGSTGIFREGVRLEEIDHWSVREILADPVGLPRPARPPEEDRMPGEIGEGEQSSDDLTHVGSISG